MEKDIERERLLKEDLQKKINLLNVENEQLQRDVESLRDEMENIRYWLLKFDITHKFNHFTEVRFASFLSGGFTTMAVINPPERKLEKRSPVQCLKRS